MDYRILSSTLIIAILLTSGCLTTSSSQPAPSPAPAIAVPLTVAINATPSRYNPAMSSTIGIRLTPVNTSGFMPLDAEFTWQTDFGTFYHWGPPDFRVVELAPKYTGTAEPVYWSYFSEHGTKQRLPVNITLAVTDPSSGKVIANATLHVGWEDPLGYTAVIGDSG
jgi:hypothetical protein